MWNISSYIYYGLIYILPEIYRELAKEKNENLVKTTNKYDIIISQVMLSCIFEIPSDILTGILPNIKGFGRLGTILLGFVGTFILSFLCIISTNMIPLYSSLIKGFINMSFTLLYVFTLDLFPTYMKTTGLGISNFFSRIGGFTTPFINQYLLRINIHLPYVGFCVSSGFSILLTLVD